MDEAYSFVELFCGEGWVSKVMRAGGHGVASLDIRLGEGFQGKENACDLLTDVPWQDKFQFTLNFFTVDLLTNISHDSRPIMSGLAIQSRNHIMPTYMHSLHPLLGNWWNVECFLYRNPNSFKMFQWDIGR